MTVLSRSTVPHAWREAFALFAITAWMMVAVYVLMDGPVLWLLRSMGPFEWATISS